VTLRAAVVASSLNIMGGAEKVAAAISAALSEMRFKVSILTWNNPNFNSINANFDNINLKEWKPLALRFKELYNINPADSLLSLSSSFLGTIHKRYDLVVSTDLVPVFADIWYVHFPFFALIRQEFQDIANQQLQARSRFDMARMKVGYILFRFLLNRSLLLTNSSFTKKNLEKVLNRNATVLYPPVETRDIIHRTSEKKDVIVTVGRFKPAKNLEVIPAIAANVKKGKFILAGYAENPEYVRKIKRLVNKYGLNHRVILKQDCTREELLSLLSHAKVYLHTALYEHFGISIVEGMAARAIPVIHPSGGSFVDILQRKQGLYGFMYKSAEEAAGYIENLLENEYQRREIAERAVGRAMMFDKEIFMRRLKTLVRAYLSGIYN